MTNTIPLLPQHELSSLIAELRLRASWLEHIVACLRAMPFGRAHVREIAKWIVSNYPERKPVRAIEQTVTREINNFCGDAKDFHRKPRFNVFERIAPATYRLIRSIELHEIIDLQGEVRWVSDLTEGWLWDKYVAAQSVRYANWPILPLSQRLARFAQYSRLPKVRQLIERLRGSEEVLLSGPIGFSGTPPSPLGSQR